MADTRQRLRQTQPALRFAGFPHTSRRMPTVAIVGRPNVGKSALFNRLAGRKIAIVHDQPGVTRDRIAAPSKATQVHACTLIDTGGIGGNIDDGFDDQVTIEADIAMETADLILFVVDAHDGLTAIDQALAQKLRKAKPPVLLVINKVDDDKHERSHSDFTRLGLGNSIFVSAEHGRNFGELCDEIDEVIAPLVAGNRSRRRSRRSRRHQARHRRHARTPANPRSSTPSSRTSAPSFPTSPAPPATPSISPTPSKARTSPSSTPPASARGPSATTRSKSSPPCAPKRPSAAPTSACSSSTSPPASRPRTARSPRLILEEKKPCLIVLNKFDLFHPGANRTARLEEATEHVRKRAVFPPLRPLRRLLRENRRLRRSRAQGVAQNPQGRPEHSRPPASSTASCRPPSKPPRRPSTTSSASASSSTTPPPPPTRNTASSRCPPSCSSSTTSASWPPATNPT